MKRVQFLRRTEIDGQIFHAGQIVEVDDKFAIPHITEPTGKTEVRYGFLSEVLIDKPVAIVLPDED